MNSSTLHVGIVDGGTISEHMRARRARPTALRVSAVYGQDFAKVAHLAERFGGKPRDSWQTLLEHKPLDLILNW